MTRRRHRDQCPHRYGVMTGVIVAAVVLAIAVSYGTYLVLTFAYGRGP